MKIQHFKIKFGIQISLIIGTLFLGVFIVPNLYAEIAQAASQLSIIEKEHFIRFFEHPVYFYAKIDSDGNITEYSDSLPISEKMLTRLVDLAYSTNSSQGLLEPDSMDSYLFTNRTLKPIKKAWDRQIEFSADASHEVRSPLSIIQLNLELINAQPDATIHSQKNSLMESTMKVRLCQNLLKTYFFFQD